MELDEFIRNLNSLPSHQQRAKFIADEFVLYNRKRFRYTMEVSKFIFNSGLPISDSKLLLSEIYNNIVKNLEQIKPGMQNLKLSTDCSKKEVLRNFAKSFNFENYNKRKWQDFPIILKNNDFYKYYFLKKYEINLGNYKANRNSLSETELQEMFSKGEDLTFNNNFFYVDKNKEYLFAKVMSYTYYPKTKEIADKPTLTKSEYTIGCNASYYLIPDGNRENAINVLRYDSVSKPHKNQVFYDSRHKEIFGEQAGVPHFHFHNNIENMLHIKKMSSKPEDNSYCAAGANAIDCSHLIKYLKELDLSTEETIDTQSYGMPFRQIKIDNKPIKFDVKFQLENFFNLKNVSSEAKNVVFKKYDELFNNSKTEHYEIFGDLINALDVINYVYSVEANYIENDKVKSDLILLESNMVSNTLDKMYNASSKKEELKTEHLKDFNGDKEL